MNKELENKLLKQMLEGLVLHEVEEFSINGTKGLHVRRYKLSEDAIERALKENGRV